MEKGIRGQIELKEQSAFSRGSQRVKYAFFTSFVAALAYKSHNICNSFDKDWHSFRIFLIKLFHLFSENLDGLSALVSTATTQPCTFAELFQYFAAFR